MSAEEEDDALAIRGGKIAQIVLGVRGVKRVLCPSAWGSGTCA